MCVYIYIYIICVQGWFMQGVPHMIRSQELALDKDLQKLRERHDVVISRAGKPVKSSKCPSVRSFFPTGFWSAMERKSSRFI